jgi:hypothetical protein
MEVGQTRPSAKPRQATGSDPQGKPERTSGRKKLVNKYERIDSAPFSRIGRQRTRRMSPTRIERSTGSSSHPADEAGKTPNRKERAGEKRNAKARTAPKRKPRTTDRGGMQVPPDGQPDHAEEEPPARVDFGRPA